MLDPKDRHLVTRLQADGRVSHAELARELGMAPSAVLERIRKLERSGVIQGYAAKIDPEALGLGLLAYVFVQADERLTEENTGRRLASLPEVQEVHHIAGEDCYLVKVRCASTAALGQLVQERFGALESVRRTRTTIVLRTIRESGELPVPQTDEEAIDEPA